MGDSYLVHLTPKPMLLSLGNFDGCHLGHQALLHLLLHAQAQGLGQAGVVSFWPHPVDFFSGTVIHRLFTRQQKRKAIEEMGIFWFLEHLFDEGFSKLSPTSFCENFLLNTLGCKALYVGTDIRFGKDRQGDWAFLQQQPYVQAHGLPRKAIPGVELSSSQIRKLLQQGHVQAAAQALGRPFLLEGYIEKGLQLGRTLDTPTLNLGRYDQILPGEGVYAGYVWLESFTKGANKATTEAAVILDPAVIAKHYFKAALCIGRRPTLPALTLTIEAHVLSETLPMDSCYGKKAGFYFTHKLRDNLAFPGLEALKAQLIEDKQNALRLLAP